MITQLLQKINNRFPFMRDAMPISVRRWLIWNFVGGRADYEAKRLLPDRRYLEMEVLPWLCKTRKSVLFVGAGSYTYPYYRAFESSGLRFVTIDIRPSARVWGAREHIIGSILDAARLLAAARFDVVICNGVFGFGINDEQDMNRTLRSFKGILTPAGILLLGWNTD
jgi:SAM-dependent methyltransferase